MCSIEECERSSKTKGMCRLHYDRYQKYGSTDDRPKGRPATKPPHVFKPDETRPTCGHSDRKHFGKGLCRPCYMSEWNKAHPDANSGNGWRRRNPEKSRLHSRNSTLRNHGITAEQYEEMWHAQNGRCANLKCSYTAPLAPDDYRIGLVIDHHHGTGEVRGLLCGGCNRALGDIYEDIERLDGLKSYLTDRSLN